MNNRKFLPLLIYMAALVLILSWASGLLSPNRNAVPYSRVLSLFEQELCVREITELLGMTQSAISHQLRILKQMKLVKNRREGKAVFYSLADGHIKSIISQGMEHITE